MTLVTFGISSLSFGGSLLSGSKERYIKLVGLASSFQFKSMLLPHG